MRLDKQHERRGLDGVIGRRLDTRCSYHNATTTRWRSTAPDGGRRQLRIPETRQTTGHDHRERSAVGCRTGLRIMSSIRKSSNTAKEPKNYPGFVSEYLKCRRTRAEVAINIDQDSDQDRTATRGDRRRPRPSWARAFWLRDGLRRSATAGGEGRWVTLNHLVQVRILVRQPSDFSRKVNKNPGCLRPPWGGSTHTKNPKARLCPHCSKARSERAQTAHGQA